MRASELKGKKIEGVRQRPVHAPAGGFLFSLEEISFTDGTFLRFVAVKGEGRRYHVEPTLVDPRKDKSHA